MMGPREIAAASARFAFLDDIEAAMAMPSEVLQLPAGVVPPLAALYLSIRPSLYPTTGTLNIRQRVAAFATYCDVDAALRDHVLLQLDDLAGEQSEFNTQAMNARMAAVIGPCMRMKSILVDFVALLNWATPVRRLCADAIDGDKTAFLRLIQVDKSVVTIKPFAERIVAMQIAGDWNGFELVGRAIAARPLNVRAELPKAVAIVAHGWDRGFSTMKFGDLVMALRQADVLPQANDYDYFRKQLYKVGLKKSSHNRK